jgi:hypothetical protein
MNGMTPSTKNANAHQWIERLYVAYPAKTRQNNAVTSPTPVPGVEAEKKANTTPATKNTYATFGSSKKSIVPPSDYTTVYHKPIRFYKQTVAKFPLPMGEGEGEGKK